MQLVFCPVRAVQAGGETTQIGIDIEQRAMLLRAVDLGVADVAGRHQTRQSRLEGDDRVVDREQHILGPHPVETGEPSAATLTRPCPHPNPPPLAGRLRGREGEGGPGFHRHPTTA